MLACAKLLVSVFLLLKKLEAVADHWRTPFAHSWAMRYLKVKERPLRLIMVAASVWSTVVRSERNHVLSLLYRVPPSRPVSRESFLRLRRPRCVGAAKNRLQGEWPLENYRRPLQG